MSCYEIYWLGTFTSLVWSLIHFMMFCCRFEGYVTSIPVNEQEEVC